MQSGLNAWTEWSVLLESIQKGLLNNPDYDKDLKRLRDISNQMLEADMLDHAAVCFQEIARIHHKTDHSTAERENWLAAGNLYFKACQRQKRHCMMDSHLLLGLESCYMLALANCVKNDLIHLAGTILMEFSHHLMELESFSLALYYLQKAADLLQDDIYMMKIILDDMCECTRQVRNFDEALYDTVLVFTILTKAKTFTSPVRERLLKVEFKLLLLHLEQFIADGQQRPKSMLAIYLAQQPSRPSIMTRDEFLLVGAFVEAFKKRDFLKLRFIFYTELIGRMDCFSVKLTKQLMAKAFRVNTVMEAELQEIVNDSTIDELERRKRMFVWHKIGVKKKSPSFEDL